MSEDLHARAEHLFLKSILEELDSRDRHWLNTHLEGCSSCAARVSHNEAAVRFLRSISVRVDPALIRATKHELHRHAARFRGGSRPRWPLWTACAVSCCWTVASAPYVWRGLNWITDQLGIPNWMWPMGFGLWWLLPAPAIAIALLSLRRPLNYNDEEKLVELRR